jgi:hypothetical protein
VRAGIPHDSADLRGGEAARDWGVGQGAPIRVDRLLPKAGRYRVAKGEGTIGENRSIERKRAVLIMFASVTSVHELADTALDVCFFLVPLEYSKGPFRR